MLLTVFWGSLGLVFGALGGLLGPLFVLLRAVGGSRIFKTFYLGTLEPPSWPPRSPQQPQTAPQAPSWRGRWPHEATNAHLETYFDLSSCDLGSEINEKRKREASPWLFFEATLRLSSSMPFFHLLSCFCSSDYSSCDYPSSPLPSPSPSLSL